MPTSHLPAISISCYQAGRLPFLPQADR